jgi:hypothetical protein
MFYPMKPETRERLLAARRTAQANQRANLIERMRDRSQNGPTPEYREFWKDALSEYELA